MRILSIGGSGFVSGTFVRTAFEHGHEVHAVTRGRRPLPQGATGIIADRQDRAGFAEAIGAAGGSWDLVVDCIGYEPEDAEQDLEVFRDRAAHLVFISTDFVFDPARRVFPQPEESDHHATGGYGGKKRQCELILRDGDAGDMHWTVLRPCHIYGPGSKLGCLPCHGRDDALIARIRRGETLELVGGGHFLQQPIFARDLAELTLSCAGNARTHDRVFCTAGPDIIESRTYYDEIADALDVPPAPIQAVDVRAHLDANPGAAPFLCHRIYRLDRLEKTGVVVPATPFRDGIRAHVASLV
ncbi:MAG: NAD-dependent dehydratase [Phycisphaeraceae bacterium]|nr:NAD-dependent dehydratase [Phycisphaeraceae bacterium]